ncbi:hypothetical protein [Beduinella massiliensis]|uniref:hypothetical protein n=1 Tax=Beduinella massiliensis TaxID=1852363 RepID=UPI000C828D9A
MKKAASVILTILVLAFALDAGAEKARGIETKADSINHAQHLERHVYAEDLACTGNYVKVRTKVQGADVRGHLEQADCFMLLEISGNWARIRVTQADSSSPDSWAGMEGWVDTDYIDCACGAEAYEDGVFESEPFSPQESRQWDSYAQILDTYYEALHDEWKLEDMLGLFCEPYQADMEQTGYMLQDVDGNGTDELLIMGLDGEVYQLYTLLNGSPLWVMEGWTRNTYYLSNDGGFVNQGSDGAAFSRNYILDLVGAELVVREGVISDYDEEAQDVVWYFTRDRDLDTGNDTVISEEEAYALMDKYDAMAVQNPEGVIPFKSYGADSPF